MELARGANPILVVGKVCKGMVDGASRTGMNIEMHLGILLSDGTRLALQKQKF